MPTLIITQPPSSRYPWHLSSGTAGEQLSSQQTPHVHRLKATQTRGYSQRVCYKANMRCTAARYQVHAVHSSTLPGACGAQQHATRCMRCTAARYQVHAVHSATLAGACGVHKAGIHIRRHKVYIPYPHTDQPTATPPPPSPSPSLCLGKHSVYLF